MASPAGVTSAGAPVAPSVFAPTRLGPVTLRNHIVKAATFEGMTPKGLVSPELIEYHRRPAAGGVGMTTVAYCSVSPEGRTFRDQIWLRPDVVPGLARLGEAVHTEGAAVAVQLGHAGSFANPRATNGVVLGPSRAFAPNAMRLCRALTGDDVRRLVRDYASAARLAVDAGVDAVEVHMGHGYLLSQFLSPAANRRDDEWGGDVERRARLPRLVARAIRDEVGDAVAVYAKLNMDDGFRRGLRVPDAIETARLLEADGALDALELTGGSTSRSPMYLMRGDGVIDRLADLQRQRLTRAGMKLFGHLVFRDHPFEEAFFLPLARQFRAALSMPLILLGGITRLETMERAMAEGFELVAMARALLREPDLVHRLQAGTSTESRCIHCNQCVVEMERGGTHCPFALDGAA